MDINGTWRPVSAKLSGSEFDGSALQSLELTIKDDNYTADVDGRTESGKIKLDTGTIPISIDIVATDGPNVGKVVQAILRLTEEERLMVCYSLQKGMRPAKFASTAENKYFLVIYQKGK
jgi:uncharacterized protein (TIGR03067 family)